MELAGQKRKTVFFRFFVANVEKTEDLFFGREGIFFAKQFFCWKSLEHEVHGWEMGKTVTDFAQFITVHLELLIRRPGKKKTCSFRVDKIS